MKNSYTVYAAVSHDGSSIFQRNHSCDADSGELLEWFDEWVFDPKIVDECYAIEDYHDGKKIANYLKTLDSAPSND